MQTYIYLYIHNINIYSEAQHATQSSIEYDGNIQFSGSEGNSRLAWNWLVLAREQPAQEERVMREGNVGRKGGKGKCN